MDIKLNQLKGFVIDRLDFFPNLHAGKLTPDANARDHLWSKYARIETNIQRTVSYLNCSRIMLKQK